MRWIPLLLIFACTPPASEQPARSVKDCNRVGQQCVLKKGGLGVCMRDAEQTGYTCTPQH